jgi:lysophospholipase L1-like esterase
MTFECSRSWKQFCLHMLLMASTVAVAAETKPLFRPNDVVLFQGDSITDGNRGRGADPNHILGHGYAFIIAAKYAAQFPAQHLTFFNRGISGNKVSDLAKRWTPDALQLKPTVLSILIGINDTAGNVTLDEYEATYDKLIADTIKELPNVRLVLCEPFTLPVGERKNNWPAWSENVKQHQQIVARLAVKYHAAVVHFQKAFDDAVTRAPADYWIWDGIHPTYAGHQIMADEWIRTVDALRR